MGSPTPIVNQAGDSVESILYYAEKLGKEKIRRQIFDALYGRGQRPKSKPQIMDAAGIPASKGQQVQNALDHLSKYQLISKTRNEGVVKDGSRNLYGKQETIRAHRKEIVKYADDPKSAAGVSTKAPCSHGNDPS